MVDLLVLTYILYDIFHVLVYKTNLLYLGDFSVILFLFYVSLFSYRSSSSLVIIKMGIDYLGLTSLRHIKRGEVLIAINPNLCYMHDLDMRPLFSSPIQKVTSVENSNNALCGKFQLDQRSICWILFWFIMHCFCSVFLFQ